VEPELGGAVTLTAPARLVESACCDAAVGANFRYGSGSTGGPQVGYSITSQTSRMRNAASIRVLQAA
jgi:hypothetical protein